MLSGAVCYVDVVTSGQRGVPGRCASAGPGGGVHGHLGTPPTTDMTNQPSVNPSCTPSELPGYLELFNVWARTSENYTTGNGPRRATAGGIQ